MRRCHHKNVSCPYGAADANNRDGSSEGRI
jgi:hypothetical protein